MRRLLFLLLVFSCANAFAQRDLTFRTEAVPNQGHVVLPVVADGKLTSTGTLVNTNTNDAILRVITESEFMGEPGEILTLLQVAPYARIDLIGVGGETLDRTALENFGGSTAIAQQQRTTPSDINILVDGLSSSVSNPATYVALGFQLGDYSFTTYQQEKRKKTAKLRVLTQNAKAAEERYLSDKQYLVESVYFARNLGNEPGNIVYPKTFVQQVVTAMRGAPRVSVEILDVREMERLNMGALLGVGQGSERPPRLLIVKYRGGEGENTDFAFVGKGVTFDTGGISLKQNKGMWYMKSDMSGAAAVVAAIRALAKRGAKVNAVAIAGLAENMPSGRAIRPGDVLTTMSGKTVEIMSTDAEGRLVLSDAVHYAQDKFKPKMLIDVATLTGSAMRAMGDDYGALFTRDDEIQKMMIEAGKESGEAVWPLPLNAGHYKQLASLIADMKNTSDRPPGASTGAAFIGNFVAEDQAWAHLDIAGVDWRDEASPTVPVGHAGWGVRLLDQVVRTWEQ